MLVVWMLAGYAGTGVLVALAFVLAAAPHALGHAVPISPGGRAMLMFGAMALWPLVLWRWVRGR